MNDPGPLLVPISVKAMVLNNPAANFIRAQMNYTNLANCQSPSPAPFQSDQPDFAGDTRNRGVYLMWTLPAALRHGAQGADGTLSFPFVPNRWLVVRVYRPAGAGPEPAVTPQVAAWVVQSDALNSSTGSFYADPTQSTLTQTPLGAKVPIMPASPWQEPAATTAYFLKAVAESNPAFAAYQPFNQNIFSIHDDLATQAIGAGTLSYFVQGWYSDPAADVLAGWPDGQPGSAFVDLLARLGWKVADAAAGTRSSAYHGAVFGVPWAPNGSPPPSPKDGAKPQIAIGNTGVDAIVAFVEAAFGAPGVAPPAGIAPRQAADLLEAFQYNLLPALSQAGGEEQIERAIRNQWFGSAAAGTAWTIVDAPIAPGAPPPDLISAAEQANETAWLAALNGAQAQFDRISRELMATQRRLFELWWKQQAADAIAGELGYFPWNTSPDQFEQALDPTDPNGLIATARDQLAQLATLAAQIPSATDSVTLDQAIVDFAAAKNLPPSRQLKAVAGPRFWTAVEPVMVISGTAHTMTLDPDTTLACRWPTEVVGGLNLSTGVGDPAFAVSAAALAPFRPAVAWANLPPVSAALFAEFFLLDPVNAPLLAKAAGQSLTSDQLAALAASMAAPRPSAGTVPAVLAPFPWTQPWQPLYLDWEATWYPIPFVNEHAQPNWVFDGADYDVVPGVAQPPAGVLTGRSVLTPKPSFEFKARIDQFVRDHPDSAAATALQAIENLVATVDQWDFLSQALSGITMELASWNPVPTLLPPTTPLSGGTQSLADLVGAQAQCPPNPLLARRGRMRVPPPSTFEGLRGGQLSFARLAIVDVFGQTLEIVTGQTASQTGILTGDGLQVTRPIASLDAAGLAQLPPRLLQPARLNFQFVPGADGNPILGWVLPNHVDGSLAVYGADGTLYGALAPAVNAAGATYVFWWPAPDTPYPSLASLAVAQAQLGGFLSALQAAGPSALAEFQAAIDETLWAVDPLGDRSDTFLSVLLGCPLAVVAASLSLELQAAAWCDPAWPYTFMSPPPDPLFLNYSFPVQLGNLASRQDGLLGYFVDSRYATFNAVHVPQPGPDDPPLSGYLAQIGAGNWINLQFAASDAGPAHSLVLIMDPRAAVHAQCGILPTKEVTLVPDWVDHALAAMKATFRTGPVLAETRQIIQQGEATAVDALLLPSPAERHGAWQWRQLAADGSWPVTTLGPTDAQAVFPDPPPILRDGVLQLTGGLEA